MKSYKTPRQFIDTLSKTKFVRLQFPKYISGQIIKNMTNPKFQVFRSAANNQHYFRLRAGNGEIILSGEGYTSRQSCINGIYSVKENAPYDSRYDRKDTPGNYTFNLEAENGQIIGRSENYTTSYSRESGIAAVKRDSPEAPIENLA